jgi:hypothetical protein
LSIEYTERGVVLKLCGLLVCRDGNGHEISADPRIPNPRGADEDLSVCQRVGARPQTRRYFANGFEKCYPHPQIH